MLLTICSAGSVQELQEKEARTQNQGGDKLSMFRQQALIVSRNKQDMLEKLQMRQEEIRELESDLSEKREKSGVKSVKVLKGAEFVKYAEELKQKAKQHKHLKGELNTIMAEKGILKVCVCVCTRARTCVRVCVYSQVFVCACLVCVYWRTCVHPSNFVQEGETGKKK